MADIISGSIGSLYTSGTYKTTSSNKIEDSIKSKDLSNAKEDELLSVCKDFESYFVEQAFKALQKMVPKDEDESSSSTNGLTDYFKGELTSKYASDAVESNGGKGFGIAQTLFEQMKRNYGIDDNKTESK